MKLIIYLKDGRRLEYILRPSGITVANGGLYISGVAGVMPLDLIASFDVIEN